MPLSRAALRGGRAVGLCLMAVAAACAGGDEAGRPVDDAAAPGGSTHWSLTFNGQRSEGSIGYVSQGDGRIALHLVNREAVNLHLFVRGDAGGSLETVGADLTFGRGRQCAYPFGGAGPFSVEVVTADPDWVSGSYDGAVQCEGGASPIHIDGTFRIRRTS